MRLDDAPDPDLLAIELGLGEFTVLTKENSSPLSGEIWQKMDWTGTTAYTVQLNIGGTLHTRSMSVRDTISEKRRDEFVQALKVLILHGAGLITDHGQFYSCKHCRTLIDYIKSPAGSWWSHLIHPSNDHDAEPDEASLEMYNKRFPTLERGFTELNQVAAEFGIDPAELED
jgi:hypothetical protein